MNDQIIRASGEGLLVFAASMPVTCDEASRRHNCTPVAAAAVGRTMIAAALYSDNMKNAESVAVKIDGGGPAGRVIATADTLGNVRGYAHNPHAAVAVKQPGKLDVGAYCGTDGIISVTRYSATGGSNFTGSAELVNGEIGDDFANYLLKSEQIASAVGLGVWINPDNSITTAGGFMVQALPDCPVASLDILERNVNCMRGVTDILLSAGNQPEALLEVLFEGLEYKVSARKDVRFKCNCDYERIILLLHSLSESDLEHLLQDEQSEMVCHFCNEKYLVSRDEIERILKNKQR